MTQPIQEPGSSTRTDARLTWGSNQLFRRPSPSGAGILPIFRATIEDTDLTSDDYTTQRRPYFPDNSTDTVFWNSWWHGYNTDIFNPTIVTEPISGTDCVSHVELLVDGIYGIRASIDVEANENDLGTYESGGTLPLETWIGSNFDEGGTVYQFADLWSNWIGMWTLDQWRIVAFFPGETRTGLDTGAEVDVEITFGYDHPTVPELYIPGGNAGWWAQYPTLTIMYLGAFDMVNYDAGDLPGTPY